MDKLVFTPSEEDLCHAYGLHVKQAKWKRAIVLISFATIVGIILAGIDGFESTNATIGLILAMALWGAFLAAIMQYLLSFWWFPRYSKKIYKQQKDLHLETTIWWDDDSLHSSTVQSTARFNFADAVKWRANDKIILLYRSEQLFNFLPTRIFKNQSYVDALIRRLQDSGIEGERE